VFFTRYTASIGLRTEDAGNAFHRQQNTPLLPADLSQIAQAAA